MLDSVRDHPDRRDHLDWLTGVDPRRRRGHRTAPGCDGDRGQDEG
jgi:hypothetical protein